MWPIKLRPWTWALLSPAQATIFSCFNYWYSLPASLPSSLLADPTPSIYTFHSTHHAQPSSQSDLSKTEIQSGHRWMVFNYPRDKIRITGGPDEIPLILLPTSLSYPSSILALSSLSTPTLEGSLIQPSIQFIIPGFAAVLLPSKHSI